MGLYAGQVTEPTLLSGRGVFENMGRSALGQYLILLHL